MICLYLLATWIVIIIDMNGQQDILHNLDLMIFRQLEHHAITPSDKNTMMTNFIVKSDFIQRKTQQLKSAVHKK